MMKNSLRECVDERVRESARVVRLAREHRDDLLARLDELRALSPGVGELIEAQASMLELASEALRAAFEVSAQGSESWGEVNPKAASELEQLLWYAQGRIAEPYGPEMLQLYGLEESPPASYRALATYAHNAVALLRAQPQQLAGRFNDHLETEHIAQLIDAPLHALDDYLVTLDDAPGELRSALVARDQAADHWVRVWRGTSTVLSGLFYLAGRADLAASVRPILPGLTPERDMGELGDMNAEEIERTSSL